MDSLRDPRNLGCELGVGEPETQERARGPTHTRHFLERIEIPAPSGQVCALWRYLAYVVEGHASACPQTVGVSESVWR